MNYKVSVARLVTGTFSLHDSENRMKKMLVGKQNPFFFLLISRILITFVIQKY